MGAKQLICQISDLGGAFALGQLARRRHRGYVRAVNYHGTPRENADNFRRQLEFYQRHFVDTPRSRLEETLSGKAGKPAFYCRLTMAIGAITRLQLLFWRSLGSRGGFLYHLADFAMIKPKNNWQTASHLKIS